MFLSSIFISFILYPRVKKRISTYKDTLHSTQKKVFVFYVPGILIVQYFSYQQPPSPEKMTTHTTHATKIIINWKTNICHMIYLLESKHVDEKEINYIYIYKDL